MRLLPLSTNPSPCPQVSYLGLEESGDKDPCKFVLSCRGSAERFTLQAANVDVKQVWIRHIQELLDAQSNFLSGDQCPGRVFTHHVTAAFDIPTGFSSLRGVT